MILIRLCLSRGGVPDLNYYISDLHFNHDNIIRLDGRPFGDVDQMNEVMIFNWNERVSEGDHVYVLGDMFWKNEDKSLEIIKRLKGHKHLVQGNHDMTKGRLRFKWDSIDRYLELKDDDKMVILSHYPILFYNGQHRNSIMLYGHVHATREWWFLEQCKKNLSDVYSDIPCHLINVGCMLDYMNYTPRTLAELLEVENANT